VKYVIPCIVSTTVSLVAVSVSTAAAATSVFGGIGVDGRGNIVVVRADLDRVLVFATGSDGDAAPARTIEGYRTDLRAPAAVAVGKSGKTYVLNAGSNSCESITVYAPGAHGDAPPVAEITGDMTGLCGGQTAGRIAISAGGTIYVSRPNADEVLAFAPGSDGNAAPAAILGGEVHAQLRSPSAVAVDLQGRVLVADTGVRVGTDSYVTRDAQGNLSNQYYYTAPVGPAVRLFSAAAGDEAPLAAIEGSAAGIAAAPNGDVLVLRADSQGNGAKQQPEINIWQLAGDGYSMIEQIVGTDTALANPIGVAEDVGGRIYALDDRCSGTAIPPVFEAAVVIFSPNSSGDAKPSAVIDGPRTGLGCP
jgi:hypothetical protein